MKKKLLCKIMYIIIIIYSRLVNFYVYNYIMDYQDNLYVYNYWL